MASRLNRNLHRPEPYRKLRMPLTVPELLGAIRDAFAGDAAAQCAIADVYEEHGMIEEAVQIREWLPFTRSVVMRTLDVGEDGEKCEVVVMVDEIVKRMTGHARSTTRKVSVRFMGLLTARVFTPAKRLKKGST